MTIPLLEKRTFKPVGLMANKILDDARDVMRRRHYSIRTEKSYCNWIKRYIKHFNMQSRADLDGGKRKVEQFLTHLAMAGQADCGYTQSTLRVLRASA